MSTLSYQGADEQAPPQAPRSWSAR